MSEFIGFVYIFIPFLYLFLVSTTERDEDKIVEFHLWGGLLLLLFYMFTLIFVEGVDKHEYLDSYLDAENYYGTYTRELFWGKLQIFLSSVLMKNEILYWLFYSVIYCAAYFVFAKRFFPDQYSGYFVLCVIGCMGFVTYGSNTIRAGFGLALVLLSFCSENRWSKLFFAIVAVGCNMPMLIPICGYLCARYVMKKERWCEWVWLIFLALTATTSIISDIMMLASGLDARAEEYIDLDGTHELYNVGFRLDFVVYSLAPVLFARYNMKNLVNDLPLYNTVYRAYLLVNSLWLLLIRMPYTDRFAYLSWFMIPFLLLYPVLNGYLNNQRPQRYVLRAIGLFLLVNAALSLKSLLN